MIRDPTQKKTAWALPYPADHLHPCQWIWWILWPGPAWYHRNRVPSEVLLRLFYPNHLCPISVWNFQRSLSWKDRNIIYFNRQDFMFKHDCRILTTACRVMTMRCTKQLKHLYLIVFDVVHHEVAIIQNCLLQINLVILNAWRYEQRF